MGLVDDRIRYDAELFRRGGEALHPERRDTLRFDLKVETQDILARCVGAGAALREGAAVWLRDKTFDETYRGYGAREEWSDSKERFTALLDMCDGDESLLLTEYTRALTIYFPIEDEHFQWAPRLLKTSSGRLTVVHEWRSTNVQ